MASFLRTINEFRETRLMRASGPELENENQKTVRRKIMAAPFAAFAAAIIIWGWGIAILNAKSQLGGDFPVFYIPAHLPIDQLYSPKAFDAFWKTHLAPLGVIHWAPYVRPAVFSLFLRPLALLSYPNALQLWLGGGALAYLAAVAILLVRFRLPVFLILPYAAYFPAMAGIITGADISIYLLALSISLALLERGRDGLAGCALTLCLCKFNLFLLVPVVLLFHRRFRAFTSFAVGTVVVAASSIALTPSIGAYLTIIRNAPAIAGGFYPVGLRGFSVAIGQPWCYPWLAAAVLVLCCWLFTRLPLVESLCVAVTGGLLVVPYVTWYDSTLLALPLAVAYAKGGKFVRTVCVAVLIGIPLWVRGGGYNGPMGFTHVAVEAFLLGYFMRTAGVIPSFRLPQQALAKS
jgi:hypothetical protein